MTYQWLINETASQGYIGEIIDGADSDTYTLKDFQEAMTIECRVSDGYGERQSVFFHLRVDNAFSVYAEQMDFVVNAGDPVTLHVVTLGNDLSKVTYEWWSGDELLDCTGDTYVIDKVERSATYYCYAYDGYGNYDYALFFVGIENIC